MKEYPIIFSAPMVQANHAGRKRMTRRVIALDQLKVVMRKEVQSDFPLNTFARNKNKIARASSKLKAWLNRAGAVSCLTPGGELGLRPGEFDFVCPYAQGETIFDKKHGRGTWTIVPQNSFIWVREAWNISLLSELAPNEPIGKPAVNCIADNQGFTPACADGVVYKADGVTNHPHYGKARWRPSIHMPRWACRDVYTVTKVRLERLQDTTEEDAIAEGVELVDHEPNDSRPIYRDYFLDDYAWSALESFQSLWYSLNHKRPGCRWEENPWVWVIEYDNPLWRKV